ncbi:TIGR03915 family putative DNA repair protein [Treponema sp. R6D11]
MRINLSKLFLSISNPTFVIDEEILLDLAGKEEHQQIDKADIDFVTSYFSKKFDVSLLEGAMRYLFELSTNAFDNIMLAWISELAIEREIIAYGRGVLAATHEFNNLDDKRKAAERAANNRTNSNALTVLTTAGRVQIEVHRIMGLLRFSVNEDGEFIARCEPDHFVLPCIGEFFTARFGDTPWSIIDEKRGLFLHRKQRGQAKINFLEESLQCFPPAKSDEWEELWKHYHKTINNEDRNNPDLQKQFIPKRYWKHIPEM